MKKYTFLLLIIVGISKESHAQTTDAALIEVVMNTQAKDWNKGDIDAFMQSYWKSDSLLFVGSKGPAYGWQTTMDNYKKHYPDTTAMGKLDFSRLTIQLLSADHAFVFGKWHLARTIGDIGGYFTLLFRKINGHWVIVADHSS